MKQAKNIAIVLFSTLAFLIIMGINANTVSADAIDTILKIVKGNAAKEKLADGRYQIKQKSPTKTFIYGSQIETFPIIIDRPGSYVLTSDIQVSDTAANGIEIQESDVTLDLGGFRLLGPGSETTGNGIYMYGKRNVEICNGTVQGFGLNGICEAGENGDGHRIINVQAISNGGDGISLKLSETKCSDLVKDCDASENKNCGINVGGGAVIIENVCYGNESHGISADGGARITGNTIRRNKECGISCYGGLITGNVIVVSDKSGIKCQTAIITGNLVGYNNQSGSQDHAGIHVQGTCLVKSNKVQGGHTYSICVSGEGNVIEANLVALCTGTGIHFSSSNNFYANNRSTGNTTNYAGSLPTGSGDGGGNVEF